MKVDGKPYRTIWLGADGTTVQAIDQTLLPHRFVVRDLATVEDAERAIRTMIVRGAPLIGAAAAYGMALAMAADPSDANLTRAATVLLASRPTAVNLRWAIDDLRALLAPLARDARLVTVLDGHPLALSWLGGVRGQLVVPLGIEGFGQSGDIPDLYRTYRLDAAAIIDAVARAVG